MCVPIVRGPLQKQVGPAKALAQELAAEIRLITAGYQRRARPVLVDYNQNRWGARWPRSIRCGRGDATVSTPVTWEESSGATIEDSRCERQKRVAKVGDLEAARDD